MSANCQTVQLKKNFQMDFRGNSNKQQTKNNNITKKEVSLPQEMSVTTTRCLPW